MADEPVENSHEEEYEVETSSRYSELYKNTAVRVVGVIIVVVLLVLAGRFIHHQLKKNDNTPSVTVTSQKVTSTTPQNGTSTSGNGSNGSSSGSGSSNSGSTNTQAQSSSQVPNTGPGDVAAIFLAVTFAGYLLHLVVADRKSN